MPAALSAPTDNTAHDELVRTSTWLPAALATAFLLAGCGGAPTNPVDTTPVGTTPAGTTPAAATPAGTPGAAASAESWTMPDLVGSGLQDAQDAIQALTSGNVLITTSSDATGQGRNQVVDSNWQVCAQNTPAGDQITRDTLVVFDAVKLDETCP